MLIEGIKFSCTPCIKGHRQANCNHQDRELFEVKRRGRPITACDDCRAIRKENNSHKTCTHCTRIEASEPQLVRTLPNGAGDPSSMALVRRSSSVRSRSSASSVSHAPVPALPGTSSGSTSNSPVVTDEDLSTVGRKKSVCKSRKKDSTAAAKPHDLSHGHSAHHPAHQSTSYSPYPHTHAHTPNHAPLSVTESSVKQRSSPPLVAPIPVKPVVAPGPARPMTNEELASSFFTRGFDQLEASASSPSSASSPASPVPPRGSGQSPRPDASLVGQRRASQTSSVDSSGIEVGSHPRPTTVREGQVPSTGLNTLRPAKERKRSGLAQMYGAGEDDDEEDEQRGKFRPGDFEQAQAGDQKPVVADERQAAITVSPPPPVPQPQPQPSFGSSLSSDPIVHYPASIPPSTCDYSVPRPYAPPMNAYSSTAPSAYSAYSGYTPPLERTQSYSVEDGGASGPANGGQDASFGFGEFQPQQQTDLDILEWISTIAPLPPSSTPVTAFPLNEDNGVNLDASAYPPSHPTNPDLAPSASTNYFSVQTPTSMTLPYSDLTPSTNTSDQAFEFSNLVLSPTQTPFPFASSSSTTSGSVPPPNPSAQVFPAPPDLLYDPHPLHQYRAQPDHFSSASSSRTNDPSPSRAGPPSELFAGGGEGVSSSSSASASASASLDDYPFFRTDPLAGRDGTESERDLGRGGGGTVGSTSREGVESDGEEPRRATTPTRRRGGGGGGAGGQGVSRAALEGEPDSFTSFDASEIHLERYGFTEAYFASSLTGLDAARFERSFGHGPGQGTGTWFGGGGTGTGDDATRVEVDGTGPAEAGDDDAMVYQVTKTPSSTPVSFGSDGLGLADWEKRIEATRGLMMHEFGQRFSASNDTIAEEQEEEQEEEREGGRSDRASGAEGLSFAAGVSSRDTDPTSRGGDEGGYDDRISRRGGESNDAAVRDARRGGSTGLEAGDRGRDPVLDRIGQDEWWTTLS
ncbi:hypothetical protein JCM10212_005266 [Sporobolomyces blumeae]